MVLLQTLLLQIGRNLHSFFSYSNILRRFLRLITTALNDVFIAQQSEIIILLEMLCKNVGHQSE